MRLEHLAADKLFVDFAGKQMHYIDRDTGELIACQTFVASLPFSDYCFVMAVRTQRVDDFLYALECCLRELGGTPAVLVPDNLKSEVEAIREKVKAHNQTRMQQKPYCREERFLAAEKHLLRPLPSDGFEVKYYSEPKVAHNNHIYLGKDKHYYSVPFAYVGVKVQVIYTRSMVKIYARGKQIAVHIRNLNPAGYSTQKDHLSSHHRYYLERSPDYYVARAKEKSPELHLLFQMVFGQNRHPEQLYRTCDGLLRLQKTASPEAFSSACELAMEVRNLSYRFVERILKNNMVGHQDTTKQEQSLPEHQNIRGKEYYSQSTIKY